ncbi:MAG: methyltransferase domain-containing protein [Mariniblastus sp.]|nr:methyltransferase domain-containing protein [Mariniblastus sp.]
MQPELKSIDVFEATDSPSMLNIGCGRTYHPGWLNLDLRSTNPDVVEHDITRGIPCPSGTITAVYHSHVLEHLKPEQGVELLKECYRVLQPGGILRVVVPDLERIAYLYLNIHEQAWKGETQAQKDYDWIKLELLDQMVRESSGGRMGRYMAAADIQDSEFVRSRVGDEFWLCRSADSENGPKPKGRNRINRFSYNLREKLVRGWARFLLGDSAVSAIDEGLFRSRGEIHRWMYDRFSLRELCTNIGFETFEVMSATTSKIENFSEFELDSVGETVRKPDSLFIECHKTALPVSTNRRAS